MIWMVAMLAILVVGTWTTALKCYTCNGFYDIIDCPLQNCSDRRVFSESENDTFGCYLQSTKNDEAIKRGCFSTYEWLSIQNMKNSSTKFSFCYEDGCNVDLNRFVVNNREKVHMTTLRPDDNTISTNPGEMIGNVLGISLFIILTCCCCWFSLLRYDKKRRRKNATSTSNTSRNNHNYSTDPYINNTTFVPFDHYSIHHNSSYKNFGDNQCHDNSKNNNFNINDSKNDHCGNNDSAGGDNCCEIGNDSAGGDCGCDCDD